MRNHLLRLVLSCALILGCDDDSTSPEPESATFSRMMGGSFSNTYANDVLVTSSGLRVVVGAFDGTLHVTGSSDTLVAVGAGDMFMAAFRDDGTVAWLRQAGGGGGSVAAYRASRDASDNIYVAGIYVGNVTFGATNLAGVGSRDVLVAKMDANGNPLWASGSGAGGDDRAWDVATAADGGVYVCGEVSSEIKVLGEDVGEFGSSAGFLVRGQSSGVGNWSQSASGTGSAICYGVARSGDGSVLVCGSYSAADVEIGGELLPLDGTVNAFIARFTDDGMPAGNIRIGGTGEAYAYKIIAVGNEPVVVGVFSGTADFDVTSTAGSITSAGFSDAFVVRYTEEGTLLWVKKFGSANNENGLGISRIGSNDLFLVGTFNSTLTLGSQTLESDGGDDFFLAHLGSGGNVLSAGQIGGQGDGGIVTVTSIGETVIVAGESPGSLTFPDGRQRSSLGINNGFIYQE